MITHEITQERETFRIGDLATRYGVSAEAIRQWERRGLIPPARRTPGGHRRYSLDHQRALDAIIIPCAPAVRFVDAQRSA
jgi:hypothetical protein